VISPVGRDARRARRLVRQHDPPRCWSWRCTDERLLTGTDGARRLEVSARQGLVRAGVAAQEADRLLEVIAARAATGQTGAVWQRKTLAALEARLGREGALQAMLERYLACAATQQPVHTWPTP
jgi:hypothetical protein